MRASDKRLASFGLSPSSSRFSRRRGPIEHSSEMESSSSSEGMRFQPDGLKKCQCGFQFWCVQRLHLARVSLASLAFFHIPHETFSRVCPGFTSPAHGTPRLVCSRDIADSGE